LGVGSLQPVGGEKMIASCQFFFVFLKKIK
jgi:hypothetical protein